MRWTFLDSTPGYDHCEDLPRDRLHRRHRYAVPDEAARLETGIPLLVRLRRRGGILGLVTVSTEGSPTMGRTGDRLRCCIGGRDLLSHSGLRGPALNHAFSGLPVIGNNRSADGEGNEYTAIRCARRPGQHDIPRIGIVDLMATTARGLAQRQFARLVESALRHNSLCAEVNIVNLDAASSWPRLAGTRADWDRIA